MAFSSDGFLPPSGGFRNLKAFRMAQAAFDLTMVFVRRFVDCRSRTTDQMQQAARSGCQNIGEGSEASRTSRETEIKLTNVARASLQELLLDYTDYLRQNNLEQWPKDHPRTVLMRDYLCSGRFLANPVELAWRMPPLEFANLMVSLIHQTSYMLDRLLEAQQRQFLQQGGIRETMHRARTAARLEQAQQLPPAPCRGCAFCPHRTDCPGHRPQQPGISE